MREKRGIMFVLDLEFHGINEAIYICIPHQLKNRTATEIIRINLHKNNRLYRRKTQQNNAQMST
jgi:hypothetical protein